MSLLIFDCDGVLVDSEVLANAALADLMTELGRPMTTEQAVGLFTGRQLRDVLVLAEGWLDRPIPADLGERAGAAMLERLRRGLKAVAGAREAIAALPEPRCVASSSKRERIALSLEVTGLAPLFGDRVFSAEQVAQGKPAPDLFLLAASSLGVAPGDCIVVEDSPLGIRAARAARMTAVGFAGASHATPQLATLLAEEGATVVLRSMQDLAAAVKPLLRP
ncbi:MAG TPA: HAD-IA family hydrolase [Pseudolabrys sp.]|nr:HAD-IA family hydrolase [Pseudolabrys sp.]